MENAKKRAVDEDDSLMARLAVDDLYRRQCEWLRDVARRRLRLQPADAEDIVQEAYLRLAQQQVSSLRSPRAFLSQVTLNLFRDGRRRSTVRERYAASAESIDSKPHSTALGEQEARLQLEQIVMALPEPQRDVFVLSRFRHMTNREIAEHLGISIKTVEWRMSRALDFCISRLRD